jgi:hypothetical protein
VSRFAFGTLEPVIVTLTAYSHWSMMQTLPSQSDC